VPNNTWELHINNELSENIRRSIEKSGLTTTVFEKKGNPRALPIEATEMYII